MIVCGWQVLICVVSVAMQMIDNDLSPQQHVLAVDNLKINICQLVDDRKQLKVNQQQQQKENNDKKDNKTTPNNKQQPQNNNKQPNNNNKQQHTKQ